MQLSNKTGTLANTDLVQIQYLYYTDKILIWYWYDTDVIPLPYYNDTHTNTIPLQFKADSMVHDATSIRC